jgi:hypothetical protein
MASRWFSTELLASTDEQSWNWQTDFISTYVGMSQFGNQYCRHPDAHFYARSFFHGQQVNKSSLGKSLEVSLHNYSILLELHS